MRKSAIPLIFFVVMCSLNILLAGCGSAPVASKAPSPSTTVQTPAVAPSAECNSCHARNLANSIYGANHTLASFQTAQETFPPTTNLIDSKTVAALQNSGLSSSMYSRSGNTITLTYPDSGKIVVTVDSLGRVKEVKEVDTNNQVVERFQQIYGTYSAPIRADNLLQTSPAVIATVNYNSSQQIVSVTDNVNERLNAVSNPVSPYPPVFYDVAPPAESKTLDTPQQSGPSAQVQACWNGCKASYEQAKAQANSDLAVATAAALAVYLAGLAICLASTVAYPICALAFYTAYVVAMATATAVWINALQSALDSYKNCLSQCCIDNGLTPNAWQRHVAMPATVMDPWNITDPIGNN